MMRKPTHPGTILKNDIFPALNLSAARVAQILGVSRQYIGDVLNTKKAMTPLLCLKIAKLVGNSPEMWMNMQAKYNLWDACQDEATQKILAAIPSYKKNLRRYLTQ